MELNIYQEYGCANRKEYLENLADEYNVDINTVLTLALMLGESEDFDGLISALEDAEEWNEEDINYIASAINIGTWTSNTLKASDI